MEKTCLQCGGFFIARDTGWEARKKYCSRECARASVARPQRVCGQCGKTFTPRRPECTTYCSRECAFTYKTTRAIERKNLPKQPRVRLVKKYAVACVECGQQFVADHASARLCSDKCRTDRCRRIKKLAPAYLASLHRHAPVLIECQECGATVSKAWNGKTIKFCSLKCMRRANARNRRARLQLGTPDPASMEPFGSWEIYRRDKFRCQICGEPVNLAVDCRHPYAPTLDHVVPLAKGGTHTRANVQCAHQFCNSLKSDSFMPSMFFAINTIHTGMPASVGG